MEKGKVKFFSKKKGFGYIKRRNKEDVHIGFDSFEGFIPKKGDYVKFNIKKLKEGGHAINMQLIDDPPSKIYNYKLPKDSRNFVRQNIKQFDNFNLNYQKYINFNIVKNKFDLPEIGKNIKFRYLEKFKKKFKTNLKQSAKNIEFIGFKAKTASRLLVGLGDSSVIETSLKLEHIYGFPYIPGSAIKGVLRNYLINEYFKNFKGEADEKIALDDRGFCDIFGCPKESVYKEERQGKVFFFDSIPNEHPEIERDVMTPHYGEYYNSQGENPPTDYYSPNIIDFLGISTNIEFNFYLGIKKKDLECKIVKSSGLVEEDTNLLEYIKKKMIEALEFQGIGGKSAVGYGYFYNFLDINI